MTTTPADHITAFIRNLLATRTSPTPLVIGLQGPQGCGKTTACNAAVARLRADHSLRGVTISIDDFYLTRARQIALAQQHAGNIYLSQRGYPGTHDIPLGEKILAHLRAINQTRQPVAIPRYDKSLHGGEGDRRAESAWPLVEAPLDFVLLEGWCVGFTPLPEAAIADAQLAEVNRLLVPYDAWYEFFGAFIELRASDIAITVDWRIEAEQKMRTQGKGAMPPQKIRAYVEKFLPAYRLYLPALRKAFLHLPRLRVDMAPDRSVSHAKFC